MQDYLPLPPKRKKIMTHIYNSDRNTEQRFISVREVNASRFIERTQSKSVLFVPNSNTLGE